MNRRGFFSALAGAAPVIAATDSCPASVLVDAGPSVIVVIPDMSKEAIVDIASTFFGRDHPEATKKLSAAFQSAKHISFKLTTRCEKAMPGK